MCTVAALRPDRAPNAVELGAVRARAQQGSLNQAAWGVAYPDLSRRLFLPIPGFFRFDKDRGWAMEKAWRRHWPEGVPTLGSWRQGVGEGWRPAVAFNASEVEQAGGLPLPPSMRRRVESRYVRIRFASTDIDVTTAARLSATFPYVTPISRARPDGRPVPARHLADGGYYDNTGMGIAMRWLDAAISHSIVDYKDKTVTFIRIRSSPSLTSKNVEYKDRGWLYETIGPIQTLLAVRTSGQRERAETELDFLQRLWRAQGVEIAALSSPSSWTVRHCRGSSLRRRWPISRRNGTTRETSSSLPRW